MMSSRRGFIGGLMGLVASPAIVHIGNLMPISRSGTGVFDFPTDDFALGYSVDGGFPNLSEIVAATLRNRTQMLAEMYKFNNLNLFLDWPS